MKFDQKSMLLDGDRISAGQVEAEMKMMAFERSVARLNRRNFVAGVAAAGVATAALGAAAGCSSSVTITPTPVTPASGPSVVDVLNFALNLEYLEASFYLYATTGSGLSSADMGSNAGTATGGAQISFTIPAVSTVAQNLATDEREHVEFLRTTIMSLGGTPVSMPNLNLAAMGSIMTDALFLTAARQLETVGISAYAGGAQYLISNTTGLTYAAQILDTEAQHEGFLRQLCIVNGVTSPAVDGQDLPPTATQVFNTNSNGLNAVRTTSQVLQIVYGKAGQTGISSGGFFPNGLNGNIKTS